MIKSKQDKINPSIWDQFTKKYKVTKTLRFELIPQGQTEEHIKKKEIIASQWVNGKNIASGKDAKKAEDYIIAKKLMNEMHSLFIDEALAYENIKPFFSAQALKNLYENWKTSLSKEKKDIDSFEKSKTALVKKLKEAFDAIGHKWKKSAIADFSKHPENESIKMAKIDNSGGDIMYGSTSSPFAVLKWLVQNERIHLPRESGVEYSKEEMLEIIHTFDGFHTYFTGFNENRANVYDLKGDNDKLLSTSIAHRIFEQNLEFFFQNMQKWEIFLKSINKPENKKILKEKNWDVQVKLDQLEKSLSVKNLEIAVKSLSKPESFLYFFSQHGIDAYNQLLGGLPAETEKEKVQGINEIINLTRQQLQAEKRNFPVLDIMYKQILSKSDKNFINSFNDDKEMLNAIDLFQRESLKKEERERIVLPGTKKKTLYEHIVFEFENELKELEEKPELKNDYFLSFETIHKISTDITGKYDTIQNWWFANIDQKITDKIINKTKANEIKKQKYLSFVQIETIINNAMIQDSANVKEQWRNGFSFKKYVTDKLEKFISKNHSYTTVKDGKETELTILCILESAKNENLLNALSGKAISDKKKDKEAIKDYLDANMELYHFLKSFLVKQKDLTKEQEELFTTSSEFQSNLQHMIFDQFDLIDLYNKTRNFLTKKPYSTDKIKLNFESSKLLGGFVESKTEQSDNGTQYNAYLFRKKSDSDFFAYDYYIGLSKNVHLFKAHEKDNVTDKSKYERLHYYQMKTTSIYGASYPGNYADDKRELIHIILEITNKKNIPPAAIGMKEDITPTMLLNNIKKYDQTLFLHINQIENFLIKNIEIINKIQDALRAYIGKVQNIETIINKKYENLEDIINAIDKISNQKTFNFSPVSQLEYDHAISNDVKPLFIFQIYNKDFSKNKKNKGTDNLHTLFFKGLMENPEESIFDIGTGEVFFRPASIENPLKHKIGTILKHKRYSEIWEKFGLPINRKQTELLELEKISLSMPIEISKDGKIFFEKKNIGRVIKESEIEIIKDRRYSKNKYLLHLSIFLNYQDPIAPNSYTFNNDVENFLANHPDVNIIGIDRGEKHLLYYSLINQKGEILEQGSLNSIKSTYMSDGKTEEHTTAYHKILDTKERERTEARKSWQDVENIKELKAGYLSQVVHKLATLIIEKNAIVVLEDLNFGFKRGRIKVEKQVYQNFEKTLIDKLNYLVLKDSEFGQSGHYLNAFQLTSKFESFQKLGKQSGILFYTAASYTSKVDPVTGYMQNVYHEYDKSKTRELFRNFDSIRYNGEYFEFTYDLKKIQIEPDGGYPVKTQWTVGSCVQRSEYKPKNKTYELFHVNDRLVKLFNDAGIDIKKTDSLIDIILEQDEAFVKNLFYYFNVILKMRVIDSTETKGSHDNDKIISPVAPFYDSSQVKLPKGEENYAKLPPNGDANGAFNIARKGVIILDKIGLRKDLEAIFKTEFKNAEYRPVWNKLKSPIEQVNDPELFLPVFEKWAKVTGHDISSLDQFFKNKKLDDKHEPVKKFLDFVSGLSVSKTDWQNYSQRADVVLAQKEKLNH